LEKSKPLIRKSAIKDSGEERYFYKLPILDALKTDKDEKLHKLFDEAAKTDFGKGIDDLSVKEIENLEYCVENYFGEFIEPELSRFVEKIVTSAYDGNLWVINNCSFISEKEKHDLSFFLAKEFIRTKQHRDLSISMMEEVQKKIISLVSQLEGEKIDQGSIEVKYDKNAKIVLHANTILNDEISNMFAGIFCNDVWCLFENFTDEPFCCSDNAITLYPTEKNQPNYGYGLDTYGMTLLYPISPKLLLVMMDKNKYKNHKNYRNRKMIKITNNTIIQELNLAIVTNSYKYTFFSNEVTALKYKQMCEDNECIRKNSPIVKVY